MMEEYLKRALKLARGDWSVFITRPVSAALLALAVALLLLVLLPAVKSKRKQAFVED
jgi:TctA family transporter